MGALLPTPVGNQLQPAVPPPVSSGSFRVTDPVWKTGASRSKQPRPPRGPQLERCPPGSGDDDCIIALTVREPRTTTTSPGLAPGPRLME